MGLNLEVEPSSPRCSSALSLPSSAMATAAEQSTAFHSTFVPLLNNLDEVIQGATKPSDLDEALQAVVDARSTLQERDREAPLTKRDREQYERVSRELEVAVRDHPTDRRSRSLSSLAAPSEAAIAGHLSTVRLATSIVILTLRLPQRCSQASRIRSIRDSFI